MSKLPKIIPVKNNEGEFDIYSIPEPVYRYIKQLEDYIRNPKDGTLKQIYKDRFNDKAK